jgi:acyl-CoA thioesterase I
MVGFLTTIVGASACFLALALLAAAPAPIRLLVLGDSLASGYGLPHDLGFEAQLSAALRARGYNVRFIDGAVSGDTTAGGLARLDWVLADGADAAIVELGSNDGLRGLDPATMKANLSAMLDRLGARHIPVLLAGMYAPPNMGPDYEKRFRAAFDALGERPGVVYEPFFMAGVAERLGLIQPDGLHPGAPGVRKEVALILPYVEKLLAMVAPG